MIIKEFEVKEAGQTVFLISVRYYGSEHFLSHSTAFHKKKYIRPYRGWNEHLQLLSESLG